MPRNPRKKPAPCKRRIIYGVRAVHEYLRAKPDTIDAIHTLRSPKTETLLAQAERQGIRVRRVSQAVLDAMTDGGSHQGVVAEAQPFPYRSLSELLRGAPDCLLVFDEVVDPRNLGALIRTAEAARVGGVVLSTHRSAHISPSVEKTAAGATAHLDVARVGNVRQALLSLKSAGYWLVGLSPHAPQVVYDLDLRRKTAFVLGGEGGGMRPLVERTCDYVVSVPMSGQVGSLNVSVAGGIVLYERLRQVREN